jgi:hypothetical protein
LHAFPSLQAVPFTTGAWVQPNTGSQPSVVQELPSLQLSGVPAAHVPAWHDSAPLHGFVSPHGVPFRTGVVVHPEVALQPSTVHALPSLQTSGVPATQVPLWHVSAPLQTVESAQAVPLATTGFEQTPDVQTSCVQGLLSEQSAAMLLGWQPETGVLVQPATALHASVVHALESLQLSGEPAVQVPA